MEFTFNGGKFLYLNSNFNQNHVNEGQSLTNSSLDKRAQPRSSMDQLALGHVGQLSLNHRINEARRADHLTPHRVELRTVIDYIPTVRNQENSEGEKAGVTEIVRTREIVRTKLVPDSNNVYDQLFHPHKQSLNLFQNIASHHQNHDLVHDTCCHQNQDLVCNPASDQHDRNFNPVLKPAYHNQKHTLFHYPTSHHQTTLNYPNSHSNINPGDQFGNMFSKTQNPSSFHPYGESSKLLLDLMVDKPKKGCQTQSDSLFKNLSNPSSIGYDRQKYLRPEKRIQEYYHLSDDDNRCDPPIDPNPIGLRIDGQSHLQSIKVPFGKPASSSDSSYSEDEDESSDREEVREITYDPHDGRTHSLPHLKNGPYTCPKCKEVFTTPQFFASHMGSAHYKYESFEERQKRHGVKYRRKNPYLKVVQSQYGLTILPHKYEFKSPGKKDWRRRRNKGVQIEANDRQDYVHVKAEAEGNQVAGTGRSYGQNATRAAPNSEGLYEVNVKMEL